MTDRFLNYCNRFLLPHETVFARGHIGDYAFAVTEDVEGDNGGLTKFGIDAASHAGTDIAHLTVDQARQIYFYRDWSVTGAEHLPPGWGEIACDIHVNGGDWAKECQIALNAVLPAGQLLDVDGFVGPVTVAAMQSEGKAGLMSLLHVRESYYQSLAQEYAHDRQFLAGWTNRVNDLHDFVLQILS